MLNIRLSETEHAMLAVVAEAEGLSLSDWVRQSVRKAHRRVARLREDAGSHD